MKNSCSALVTMLLIPLIFVFASPERYADSAGMGESVAKKAVQSINDSVRDSVSSDTSRNVIRIDNYPNAPFQPLDVTDSDTDTNAYFFTGDKIISVSDTVRKNVVVKGGNLFVFGLIDGNVMVIGGDLILKSTGTINGNAKVIDGSILKEDSSVIRGFIDTTSSQKASYRETRRKFYRYGRTFDVPWQDEQAIVENFIFRYNRVESIFLGAGSEKKYYWDGSKKWSAYGSIGWGFKSHTWRGNLGLSRQFAIELEKGSGIFEVGAGAYTLTDTKDQWIVSVHENTAAAFLIHEDFRDYFERRGYTIHTAYYMVQNFLKSELRLSYRADSYDSLSNRVDWALFGGHKKFRSNPQIDPGNMRSLEFLGGISTLRRTMNGLEGWCIYTTAEFAKRSWKSDFDFDRYILDLRRFQPLGRFENLNIRVRAGSAFGTLPVQKNYELGGFGTLSAFPFKSEAGNRMLLLNMEFIVNGNVLSDLDFWPTWLFDHVNFMIFTDAGLTRSVASDVKALGGFSDIKLNDFKHDFGVALSNRNGSLRLGLAWRTDHPAPVHFVLRFARPF